ncbi:MAG: thioredoxin family protein [Rhizobiales bacterium]|nr:thioredoxin family protein [Hyphomicrobiales bacterium]
MKTQLSKAMIAGTVLLASAFSAAAGQPYDSNAFEKAQAGGKSILIDVTAPWCPTCTRQRPIIQSLESSNPKLVVFDVDFDTSKDVLRRFRVQSQSTLILFKGNVEVGRSTGDTNATTITSLVDKAL